MVWPLNPVSILCHTPSKIVLVLGRPPISERFGLVEIYVLKANKVCSSLNPPELLHRIASPSILRRALRVLCVHFSLFLPLPLPALCRRGGTPTEPSTELVPTASELSKVYSSQTCETFTYNTTGVPIVVTFTKLVCGIIPTLSARV